MKVRYIIGLYLAGSILNKLNLLFGSFYPQIRSFGSEMYKTGHILQLLALIFALIKVLSSNLNTDFFNK